MSQTGQMKCALKCPISLHSLWGAKGLPQLQTLNTRPPKWDEMNLFCRNWNWARQKLTWRCKGSKFGFRPFYPCTVALRIRAFTTWGRHNVLSAGITFNMMGLSSRCVSAEVALWQERGVGFVLGVCICWTSATFLFLDPYDEALGLNKDVGSAPQLPFCPPHFEYLTMWSALWSPNWVF